MASVIEPYGNRPPLTLQQAIHSAAKRYPGGICAIAQLYGFNARTLQNKMNPTQPGCVNIEEFEAVLKCTRSARVLDAIGRIARCTWIDLAQFDEAGDRVLRDTIVELMAALERSTVELRRAVPAGFIGQRELDDFQALVTQLLAALHAGVDRGR